jgi:hypothetical protein
MDALAGRSDKAYSSTASWSAEEAATIRNTGRFGAKFATAVLLISVYIKCSPVGALSVTFLSYWPDAARQDTYTGNVSTGASTCALEAGMQDTA